jgi:uncharacterized protein YndB with AHSA1/START domain
MPNICLTFGTSAAPQKVMEAVNTIDGLNQWWTTGTSGDTTAGGKIEFRFGDHGPDMTVIKNDPEHVVWEITAAHEEWVGTTVGFRVVSDEKQTHLMFDHSGWAEETPFHHHCSMKWATFMLSMKQYLETGKGRPFPDDLHIDLN